MDVKEYLQAAPTVPAEGPLDARIWVIGDAPEKESIIEQRLFAGNSGRLLREKLDYLGYTRVRFECLVNIRPMDGDQNFFDQVQEAKTYMENSVAELKERIRNAKPNLVILLGASPLKHFLGYRSVSDWRGHVVWSDDLDCKLFTTFHPTVCIRQRYAAKKKLDEDSYEFPGQYDALFFSDLTKAKHNAQSRELNFPKVETITNPTFEQVKQEIEWLHQNARILSYDIETMGTSLCDCISLASSTTRTISVPFYYIGKDCIYPYWKNGELPEVFKMVKDLLESDIPKVAQNSKYDTVFLAKNYGIQVRNLVWDTLVAAHNIYCELPKDLGTLISIYTNLPYHKHMMKEDRWLYNALDSSSTLAVMEGQLEEFKSYGTINHYKNITNFAIRPLVAMQLEGIKVDLGVRNLAIRRESAVMEDILSALDHVFPNPVSNTTAKFRGLKPKGKQKIVDPLGHKFNPSSVPDKMWLFYDKFNLRKKFNKGQPTTNDDALEVWMEDKRSYVSLIAEGILRFQKAKAMRSRMEVPLDNGRMHSNFDVVGTVTGRLASKETFWGSGTNLQNLKVGVQRQMLIPDEGEEFALVDLWAAEAFTTAVEAKEDKLIQLLKSGYKIHTWLYDNVYKKWPEACKKLGFDNAKYAYKYFKQCIHLMNYGGGADKMSKESGLPIEVCDWIFKFYHSAFPNIKVRQVNIQESLKKNRQLTSLLGRTRVFFAPYSDDLLNEGYAWPSQSCIGEITVIAMSKLYYSGLIADHIGMAWTFPAMNTHDGIAIRCRKGNREAIKKIVKDNFHIPIGKDQYKLTVPVEIGFGPNFNDITNKEVLL